MKINRLLFSVLIIAFSWFTCAAMAAQNAVSQGNPTALLQYVADNMISGLKHNKATLKTKPALVYKLAYQYVVPYADLAEMSKRVLPPQTWNQATPTERMQFEKEFTTTLIRTYASALAAYEDQTVHFYPVRGGYQSAQSVEVNSEITGSNSEPIRVAYRMVRKGSVWRLYDLSVEGVSMLESFRAQFSTILGQGNMQQLLSRMSQHNQG